jgi:phosphonoacetaldehyde hydrolase
MKGYGLDLAVVDFGGSYVDFGIFAPAVVFRQIFREFGVPISMMEAREPMGAHKRIHIQKISEMERVRKAWREVHGSYPTLKDVDNMFEKFIPAQTELLLDYNNLIPGALEFLEGVRERGVILGSTTGYTGDMMMDVIVPDLVKKGFRQDIAVASTGDYAIWDGNQFRRGKVVGKRYDLNSDEGEKGEWTISRPFSHMCNLNGMLAGIPYQHLGVKIGDTLADIDEGYRAGMWTIGLAVSGNEVGASLEDWLATPPNVQDILRQRANKRMIDQGADYVVDTIADVIPIMDEISERNKQGELPNAYRRAA